MKQYEVTAQQFKAIYDHYRGYVFNRVSNGRYYVKLNPVNAARFGLQ